MGCDIHLYVEKRVDGKWVSADTWTDPYNDGLDVPHERAFYHDRNYDLFAILANVRNGYGFAGITTGVGFNPIAEPRGIPEDADLRYKAVCERWNGDGHSHSYFTVAELMQYDWTQQAVKTGVVDLKEFARWKLWGSPKSWAGDISGPGVEIFPAANVIPLVRDNEWLDLWYGKALPQERLANELGCVRPHVRVEWSVRYYEVANTFLATVMPRLWRLGAPDDVRIVFFFDN